VTDGFIAPGVVIEFGKVGLSAQHEIAIELKSNVAIAPALKRFMMHLFRD